MNESNLDLAEQLITRAKNNECSKFEFIKNFNEYLGVRVYKKAAGKVAKQFKKASRDYMKGYLKGLDKNISEVELLLAVKECKAIAEFYTKETKIAKDMMSEYRSYVFGGHVLNTIIGKDRDESELVDFRTLPVRWF